MLLIVGFFFPVIGIATFFFLADGFNQFFNYFLVNFNLLVPQTYEVDLKTILIIIAPTVFFNIIGVMVALGYRRYIIYQIISQRILVISYLVILVGLMLMFKSPAENFLLLLPFVAYFNTHFFMIFGKGGFGGFVLALYLGYSLRIIYSYLPVPYLEADFLNYNNQFIVKNDWNQKFENKRIAVFGENIAIFLNNKLSTPYLDWDLSKHILLNADHYAEVIRLFGDLKSDMPEVIVDENRVMPELMQHVPLLQKKYVLSPGENQIYIKR